MGSCSQNIRSGTGWHGRPMSSQRLCSPATVYAVTGGKDGLSSHLSSVGPGPRVLEESLRQLPALTGPFEVVSHVALTSRQVREQHGDVMRTVLATTPSHPQMARELDISTDRYQRTLTKTAEHLAGLGVPRGADCISDVLWFFVGYSGYFTLVDDNRWSYDRAQQWLLSTCAQALGINAPGDARRWAGNVVGASAHHWCPQRLVGRPVAAGSGQGHERVSEQAWHAGHP